MDHLTSHRSVKGPQGLGDARWGSINQPGDQQFAEQFRVSISRHTSHSVVLVQGALALTSAPHLDLLLDQLLDDGDQQINVDCPS
jgi:hypothetical protein